MTQYSVKQTIVGQSHLSATMEIARKGKAERMQSVDQRPIKSVLYLDLFVVSVDVFENSKEPLNDRQ